MKAILTLGFILLTAVAAHSKESVPQAKQYNLSCIQSSSGKLVCDPVVPGAVVSTNMVPAAGATVTVNAVPVEPFNPIRFVLYLFGPILALLLVIWVWFAITEKPVRTGC